MSEKAWDRAITALFFLYFAAVAADLYFQVENGFVTWGCIDLNDDGYAGICIGMGDWKW